MTDNTAFNLDDIANENDVYRLAEMAEQAVSPDQSAPNEFDENGVLKEEYDTAPPEDDKDGANGKAAKEADTNVDKPGDEKADKGESGENDPDKKAASEGEDKTPEGILAKDGKHVLPYSVLENTRAAKAELDSRVAALEGELKALKEGDPNAARQEELQKDIDELQKLAEQVQEDYGEDMGAVMATIIKKTVGLTERNAALEKQIQEAAAARNESPPDDGDERRQIQEAIDANPVVAEWQSRGDNTWYKRAVDTYNQALENNAEFAGLTVAERFERLPDMVGVIYGKDPELKAASTPKQEGKTPDETQGKADRKSKDANADKAKGEENERVPFSSSDIGGSADPGGKFGPLDDMSAAAMTSHFQNMDPKQLEAFLSRIS